MSDFTKQLTEANARAYQPVPNERDRPQVMFLWLWWFVFSPVVLFLAPNYVKKARQRGFPQIARYWVPFWLTTGAYVLLGGLAAAALVMS